MKQISKKSKILVAALIAFMVVICGAVTFTPTELQSQEVTQVSTSWYEFEHGANSITIRLNDDIRSLRKAKKEDISKLKNELTSALKTMFMDEILNSTPEKPEGQGIMRTALDLDIPSYNPDTFWDDVQGNPKKFKDYIVERLGDPDELELFSEGAYDMLLEQAIGEYISDKIEKGTTGEALQQEYDKIQDAIEKVVEEAAKEAVGKQVEKEAERELAQEFAREYASKHEGEQPPAEETQKYVAEHKDNYMREHGTALQQKAKETIDGYVNEVKKEGGIVENAVQKVEQNGGSAPSITVQDMLEALHSVAIDGYLLYTKENNEDSIRNEGIRELMNKLPRPAAVANMGQEDIRELFKADFKLGTTYGDIEIKFTFGFFGTTRNIQRMAKAIADHVEVVRDGSDLTVNLTMPELVSKFFRSLYNAGGINYESKKAIFDFFDSSVADFANGKAYSFEELITLLKDINYQKLFENLLSASALNNYFGSYLTEVFGRTITDQDIERAINSLRNYALKVDEWTAQNVADFLYNIPGFKKLADSVESGKLTNVVNKFLEMVQKINWDKYDAKQIIEILKGDTINQKVLDNLDNYSDTYSGIYDKLLSSLREMCDLLPENFATDKLSTLYNEDGKLNYEGKLTLDFGEIIGKISDMIGGSSESEGESETESFLGNLKTALSSKKFEYNLKLNVTTPDINKVQFVYDFDGDGEYEVLEEGLLPTNTNIKALAPKTITFKDGTSAEVGHWVEVGVEVDENDPEASDVTTMPNRDIRLRAVFDLEEAIEIEVVNPHVVPTIKGYSPTANRRVEYTYMGGERSVRWEYELKAVSKSGTEYPSEVLKTWLSATIGGTDKATNVGNYTSTLKLTVDPDSEYAKYITLKDLKKGENGLEFSDTWTIEKAIVKVEGIKLGSEEKEGVFPGDEEYALFIKDINGGEHTVAWQFTLSVTNDYGNYWTDENIRNYLDIVEGGTLTSKEADKDLTATLKINVKEANKGNFSMAPVDETAKWMIKCEDFIPKTEIDLSGAKWMYDGKEFTPETKVEADGKQKALTVQSSDENVAQYFADGVLKVVYVGADGIESETAPSGVGTYTVKVVLVDNAKYILKVNIADTTLTIIEKVLPREKVKIDLSGAKWMRDGKEHKAEDKIITDGESGVKLTISTSDENQKYFTDGILQIVYYYKSGMKISGNAPSKVGDYIAKVEIVKSEVEKDGVIYEYSFEKNIEDALMQLRTETTVAPAETVNIDLSKGEWTLNGEKLDSSTELVEDGTFKFLKVSGLDDATARLFTKGVLTIAYYKDGVKMTHAPIDAGKYTAKVELRVTEGYNIVENIGDATFEIKARPSKPADEVIDLSEATWQYNGEEYDPTKTIEKTGEEIELTVTGIDDKYITDEIIEIVYYNGEGKMDSAPVEAGIYFVRVGLKAESGYKLGSSMETIIIITEKKAEPVEIDVSSVVWTLGEKIVNKTITVKADGTRKELSVSGLDGDYIKNGIVEIVYYDKDEHRLLAAPKTAGEYTAKLEVRGDGYTLSGKAEVTIIIEDDTTVAPAEPVEIDLSKAKWVYRGAEVTESTTIYFDGTAKNLEIEAGVIIAGYFVRDILAIEYYEGEDKLGGAPTEVGEYTAKVVLKDTENYVLKGEIEDLSFEIVEDPSYIEPGTKIAIDLTGAKWMFGDSEVTDRVEIVSDGRAKALTVSSSDAKITEYFADGILRVVYVDKDNHVSEIAPSLVGTYTVKVIVSDADRYEITNIANVTLVITEAAVQPVAKIEITLTGAKWFMGDAEFDFAEIEEDGLSKALTVGGISADLQRYFTSGVLVINYYDANGNKLFGAPKDAGVYTVKVELADANKYELKENIANATLTISEKDGNGHWWLIILTICIALVVIVAIVLVELLVISKKKKQDKPQGEDQPQEK